MNRFAKSAAFAACLLAASAMTHAAAPITNTFKVNISLTSVCTVSTAPADMSFTYTSFGSAATATGGGFAMTCTNSLPYTFALDGATPGSYTDSTTNLQYTLTLPTPSKGTGAAQSYSISGSMAAGQAGTCGVGTCNNTGAADAVRTLTVSY